MYFQDQLSSFPCGVQDFLKEHEVTNIGIHIKDVDVNNKCTYDGTTILMMVCMYSHAYDPLRYSYYIPCAVEKVKWLLSKGADPNIQDTVGGWTALMYAARHSKPVKIYKGKRFMEKFESYNIHPIEQKINHKLSLMIVNYLDKDISIEFKSSEKIVEILLGAEADPNIQDEYGWTALMYAAGYSSPERGISSEKTVKILLEAGADPNKQNRYRSTALMMAACYSSSERGTSSERTVEILLKAGADPNKQDKDGKTVLMMAARNSSPERGTSSERTVEILLEGGVDPNLQDNNGWAALMYAARNSSPKIRKSSERTVEILLKSGADPNKQTLTLAEIPSVKQLIQKYL